MQIDPQVMPGVVPDVVPEVAPGVVPGVVPQVVPEVVPNPNPNGAPPQVALASASAAISGLTRFMQVLPQVMPEVVPQVAPHVGVPYAMVPGVLQGQQAPVPQEAQYHPISPVLASWVNTTRKNQMTGQVYPVNFVLRLCVRLKHLLHRKLVSKLMSMTTLSSIRC
jgi:hypothetical protein